MPTDLPFTMLLKLWEFCTREQEGKLRCKKRSPHQEIMVPSSTNVSPWRGWCPESWETENPSYLHPNLQPLAKTVFGGTLSCFLTYSQEAYTLFDVDANFGLKMRMSEQSWTLICLVTANTIKIWPEHQAIKHFRLKWNYQTIAILHVCIGNRFTF